MKLPEKAKTFFYEVKRLEKDEKCLTIPESVEVFSQESWSVDTAPSSHSWKTETKYWTRPAELWAVHEQSEVISSDRLERCGSGDLQHLHTFTPTLRCDKHFIVDVLSWASSVFLATTECRP